MAKRKIIKIDEDKCTGCGLCIPDCPEGAIQMIDGKARLVSDLFCDGLGACIGTCPEGAITIEEREAEKYDEKKVMENIAAKGQNTIKAHLEHLKDHGEKEYLSQALEYLKEKGIAIPDFGGMTKSFKGCPGSRELDFSGEDAEVPEEGKRLSMLRQWPVQLHLVSPGASFFKDSDILVAADCVAFSLADFHKDFLKGKSLIIACPKLDTGQDTYTEKIKQLIDDANINTLTVMTMEVPCCFGLLMLVQKAYKGSKRVVPVKHIVISIKGEVLKEEWMSWTKE